jgi:signal transduction histidine kinase
MGGKVNVKSEYGKGSTFSIELIAMCKVPSINGE